MALRSFLGRVGVLRLACLPVGSRRVRFSPGLLLRGLFVVGVGSVGEEIRVFVFFWFAELEAAGCFGEGGG